MWAGYGHDKEFSLFFFLFQIRHDDDYAKDYFPDLITNSSLEFFRESKAKDPDAPVMMVMSYPGPHGPEDAAPQYKDLFFNVTTHQ